MPIKSENAENSDEAERPTRHQERTDHADQPQGRHASARETDAKALQLEHENRDHDQQHERHDGNHRRLRFLALLDGAANRDRIGGGKALGEFIDLGRRAEITTVSGKTPGVTSACTVSVGTRSRRQTTGAACVYSNDRELAERHRATVRKRNRQLAQRRERRSFFVGRAHHHIDQIDVVAHLRDGDSGDDRVHHTGKRIRAQAEKTRLVLVDLDPHLARRLDPVEVDIFGASDLVATTCASLRAIWRTCARSGPLTAILNWPSDRRAEFKWIDAGHDVRKIIGKNFLELDLEPFPRSTSFATTTA